VKFSVLALDFDGTIAESGSVSADLREALAEIRERGILIVLATGRILEDLRDVAGDLSFADEIVAENGAVVAFPRAPRRLLCREASTTFAQALERAGIAFRSGHCVIEADAGDAERILSVIRSLELPLALTFNRGRVIALPTGVCKSEIQADAPSERSSDRRDRRRCERGRHQERRAREGHVEERARTGIRRADGGRSRVC
jgi:hypothetical protein